jgi:hypothetical protein
MNNSAYSTAYTYSNAINTITRQLLSINELDGHIYSQRLV